MDFALNLFIIIADQFMLFVVNMLVARHAGEALFGDFSVATSALLLLATFITLGIDSIIAYYIPKYYIQEKYSDIVSLTQSIKDFLQPIYTTMFVSGLLCSIALIALARALSDITLFDLSHPLFLFLWGTVALSLYNIFIQYFRAVDYMRTAVVLSLLQTLCYFLLSLAIYFYIFPRFFHDDPHYFPHVMLIGFILSYLIIVLVSLIINRRSKIQIYKDIANQRPTQWREKIYGYTVQNLNRYVFATIPLMVIEWLGHNEHSVGLFSATSSIINLAFIAIAPIGILIGPDISAAFAQSREQLKAVMRKYLLICFAIALVIMAIMGFTARQVLLLYQSNFIDALPYTYACLINVVTYSISMPLSKMIQYSREGSSVGARLTMSMLLLQTIASIIFVRWLGLLGAVICYVGINIVYNAIMIVIAIRIFRIEEFGERVI